MSWGHDIAAAISDFGDHLPNVLLNLLRGGKRAEPAGGADAAVKRQMPAIFRFISSGPSALAERY